MQSYKVPLDKTLTSTRHYWVSFSISHFHSFISLLLNIIILLQFSSTSFLNTQQALVLLLPKASNFSALDNSQKLNCKNHHCSDIGYLSVNFRKVMILFKGFEVQLLVSTACVTDKILKQFFQEEPDNSVLGMFCIRN